MGVVSALAFGAFFVAMDSAADSGGAVWAVTANRATSVSVLVTLVLLTGRGRAWGLRDLRAAGAVGVLDAGANALFCVGATEGLASTVSVIGSLYPVTTVVLAAIVLHERPARPQDRRPGRWWAGAGAGASRTRPWPANVSPQRVGPGRATARPACRPDGAR